MANYLLLDIASQMLLGQANERMALLLDTYGKRSTIQSVPSLLGAVSDVFNSFYDNLGSPLVSPMSFEGPPIAEDWNAYQQLLLADMKILYTEANSITNATQTAVTFNQVENQTITDSVKELLAIVNTIGATRSTRVGLQNWAIVDTFVDTSKVDLSQSIDIDVGSGAVALSQTTAKDLTSGISFSIDDPYIQATLASLGRPTKIVGTGASNGFAGNTHEVIVTENTNPLTSTTPSGTGGYSSQIVELNGPPGQSITFAGESNMHADIAAVTDGNSTTWFEYEVCNIPDALKANPCLGYGFFLEIPKNTTQAELVPWWTFHTGTDFLISTFPPVAQSMSISPGDQEINALGEMLMANGSNASNIIYNSEGYIVSGGTVSLTQSSPLGDELILVLEGSFQTPTLINNISILPNIINNTRPTVKAVLVRAQGSTAWHPARSLTPPSAVGLTNLSTYSTAPDIPEVWEIPQILAAQIRIIFAQTQSYQTKIGHIAWLKPDVEGAPILNQVLGTGNFQDDPDYIRVDGPSLNYAQILANKGGPLDAITGISSFIPGVGNNTSLFVGQEGQVVGPLVEVFSGWRYVIGIKDISITQNNYNTTGILVSRDFQLPVDIKMVQLSVDESVPVGDTNWITYEFSLDGGSNWYPISPLTSYLTSAPRTYLVNATVSTNIRAQNAKNITTPDYDSVNNPAITIRLRATLTTPDQTVSPKLRNYSLKLEGIAIS